MVNAPRWQSQWGGRGPTVNPSLAPATVTQILKRTARAFVDAECQGGKGCGAGLADAAAAVRYARYSTWTPTPTPTVTSVPAAWAVLVRMSRPNACARRGYDTSRTTASL